MNLKINKKKEENFDLPEREFEPQIFSNFPAHDLNFHGKEGRIAAMPSLLCRLQILVGWELEQSVYSDFCSFCPELPL